MNRLVDNVLGSWRRKRIFNAPERGKINHFGQLYCPECQKTGRDLVLNELADREGSVCADGHRFERRR